MTVIISFNHLPPVTMSYEYWLKIGKEKGFCKANKIRVTQINQIEYKP